MKNLDSNRQSLVSRTFHVLAGVGAGLFFLTNSVWAEPVALVLDKSEGVSFPAFSEVKPGDVIELGNSGHIDLLDYSACREVRITSGTVTVSEQELILDGGEARELRQGNCLTADSGTTSNPEEKGLTVTLRSAKQEKKAASLMLRFGNQIKKQFDTVLVAIGGGEPKPFPLDDKVLTDMPSTSENGDPVEVELFFQDEDKPETPMNRKITINPETVGRDTAVVLVK